MTAPDLRSQIDAFLGRCRTASLATVGGDGRPHAANVQFVHDADLRLCWVSPPDAAHSRHIERLGRAAATVYAHADADPATIHGVQLHGVAAPLPADGDDVVGARALYVAKYPFVDEPPFSAMLDALRFYRLAPDWIRWIDNRRGFGWKAELTL